MSYILFIVILAVSLTSLLGKASGSSFNLSEEIIMPDEIPFEDNLDVVKYGFNSPYYFIAWYRNEVNVFIALGTNPQFMDLNGDGLVDLMIDFTVRWITVEKRYKAAYLNTGCAYINQTGFTPASYCNKILQNDNFKHLRKLLNDYIDPKLSARLKPLFRPDNWRAIESAFKAESVTEKTFPYLTKEDFISMNIGRGDIVLLQSQQ